ncbi:probable cytochrome P450 9f2 [Lucilia cuprina]|uniref:probable cytochrome P450 9f2 n=1 Tax=Lucilia cuprina TaxID=7375 RepID=UPI000E57EDAC|nr:probable cytochrome P450 9f2 [Lucilia cuprina]
MWIEFIILAIVAAILFYRWATTNNGYFKKRNLPFDKPIFLLGSGKDIIFGKKSVLQTLCEFYNKEDDIVYGVFDGRQPVYLVRDPQLVKNVMIKDFDHFVNRRNFIDTGGSGNLITYSLFFLQNETWRDMRNTLSPAFTGSKMRQMFKLIVSEIEESMKYLNDEIHNNGSKETGLELDVKDFTSRLTVDIIASTAFGLTVNSFKNKNNEFYTKAQKTIKFTALQQIKIMVIDLFPRVARIFKLALFNKDFVDYFKRLVLDAMKYRVEKNIQRPDMINLLMEARGMIPTDSPKTHFREWSDVEVVAQCFLFFFAGMEPSSAIMSFSVHELMEHAEVQEKLYQEILQYSEDSENESVTYDALKRMPYMDKVVSEMLRKWPVTLVTDRVCNKDYIYESNNKRLEIKKGEILRIPMCAIHRDPKYYSEPDIIDPERFSAENKTKIEDAAYLPFGLGPRICIANRFAIMEIKAFLFYLLRDYRLEASPKTMRPLELKKSGLQLVPEKGFWIQVVPRK